MQFIDEIRALLRDEDNRILLAELVDAVTDPLQQLFEMGYCGISSVRPPEGIRTTCSNGLGFILIDRLSRPPAVVADDLVAPLLASFSDDDDSDQSCEEYVRRLDVFLENVAEIPIGTRLCAPLQIGTGFFAAVQDEHLIHAFDPVEIYSSDSGFSIRLLGVQPEADETGRNWHGFHRTARIQLVADCTESAMNAAVVEMRSVFSTLIKSGVLLSEARFSQYFRDNVPDNDLQNFDEPLEDGSGVSLDEQSHPNESQLDESGDDTFTNYMTAEGYLIANGGLGPWFHFIPDCLAAYFAQHKSKRDSIPRRLTTAIRLLTQADMQARNGVGLALSVAAVEALLCRNQAGLAATFAENAATLLEPEPRFRANAVAWCKRLYDLRSKVLHGSIFDATPADLSNARLLAAAILKAMIERRRFQQRMDHPAESPDDLIGEMARDKYTKGQTTGVEESPIVEFWRNLNASE